MLIPVSKTEKEMAYLATFKKWIAKHPDQKRYFCDHGNYCGADHVLNRTSEWGCKECKEEGKL